jgi:hypothetical protein
VLVGGSFTYTRDQTLAKLKLFPRGTQFRLPSAGRSADTWYFRQRSKELSELIAEAGMTVAK